MQGDVSSKQKRPGSRLAKRALFLRFLAVTKKTFCLNQERAALASGEAKNFGISLCFCSELSGLVHKPDDWEKLDALKPVQNADTT
jgi:hypothetical protein